MSLLINIKEEFPWRLLFWHPTCFFQQVNVCTWTIPKVLLVISFGINVAWNIPMDFFRGSTLLNVILTCLFLGAAIAFPLIWLFAIFTTLGCRIIGGKGSIRQTLGVIAYAFAPAAGSTFLTTLSLVLLLFASPAPTLYRFIYLTALIARVCSIWSLVLLIYGLKVSHSFDQSWKSFLGPLLGWLIFWLGLLLFGTIMA